MFVQIFLLVFQNYYMNYILKLKEDTVLDTQKSRFWWQDERYVFSDVLKTVFGKESMLLADPLS